jgi:uncharacterized repeat protein (TIGR02543 family)
MQEILWQPFLPSDAILRIARLLSLSCYNNILPDFMDRHYVRSNAILINCANTDIINLTYSGNVSISVATTAFNCRGALNINGSGTLTLENTSSNNYALLVGNGDLNISGGTLSATGPIGIYAHAGDITIGGSASVTAVSTGNSFGLSSAGICANTGYDISISGGVVNATGKGTGLYDGALIADNITITGGAVTLSADAAANYAIADGGTLSITGGTVTIDGAQVYMTKLTLAGVSAATAVTAVTLPASGYAMASRATNASGEIYFLLPAGSQTVTLTAGGTTYTGTFTVATNHTNTATLSIVATTTYAVTYNLNGGTGTTPTETNKAAGATFAAAATTGITAPTGKQFKEWNTASDGTGTTYAPSATVTMPNNALTLYAIWTLNTYSVTFNSQGGTSVATQTVNHGATATEPSAPTKAGYIFGGWYKESSCINIWNFSTDAVTANTTLYAKWTQELSHDAELVTVSVNGVHVHSTLFGNKMTYEAGCGEDVATIEIAASDGARIFVNDAEHTAVSSIPLTGQSTVLAISVKSASGATVNEYQLIISAPLSDARLYFQRWSDVLAINHNPATNGGYTVTGVRWYKKQRTRQQRQVSPIRRRRISCRSRDKRRMVQCLSFRIYESDCRHRCLSESSIARRKSDTASARNVCRRYAQHLYHSRFACKNRNYTANRTLERPSR